MADAGSGSGGTGSHAYVHVAQGGLTFVREFDYEHRLVKMLDQEISLEETNVVLVDFVDSASGPTIVGRRWIGPAPPQHGATGDPIGAVVKQSPELFDYLRSHCPIR